MIESFKLPNITPETLTGSIVSFNDEYGGLPLKSCTSFITGYQEGSGTPSPDNVRPLHAWSGANLTACGVNLWDEDWESGGYDSSGNKRDNPAQIRAKNFCPCKGGVYIYQKTPANGRILFYDKDYSYILRTSSGMNRGIAVPDNACYFTLYIDVTEYENNVSINYPSLDADYHAYNGNTYTFTFGQTIYQGSIDWKRGIVRGVQLIVDLSSLTWSTTSWGAYRASIPDIYKPAISSSEAVDNLAEKYNVVSYNELNGNKPNNSLALGTRSAPNIYILADTSPTGYLTMELKTPIEIPLGGINLLTQEGQNNIFADCGDTEVKYLKVR